MKRKLIAYFTTIAILPVFLSILLISRIVSERMEEMLVERSRDALLVASNLFDSFLMDLSLKTRLIAGTKEIIEDYEKGLKIRLVERAGKLNQDLKLDFYGGVIEIFSPEGHVVLSYPRYPVPIVPFSNIRGALEGQVKNALEFAPDGRLLISSAYPLYSERFSAPAGGVAITFAVSSKLADELKKVTSTEVIFLKNEVTKFSPLATTFIVDGERKVPELSSCDISSCLEPGMNEMEADCGVVRDVTFASKHYMMAFRKMKASNGSFILAVALDRSGTLRIVKELSRSLFFTGLLSALFALILATVVARKLAAPIAVLVEHAEKLGKGDLETKISIATADEFEFLASTFDIMRARIAGIIEELKKTNARLDRKVFDLETTNSINRVIIFKTGAELFRNILSIVVEAFKAERASIFLLDSVENRLKLRMVESSTGSARPDECEAMLERDYLNLRAGEGIAGAAMLEKTAVLCNFPTSDPRFKPYEEDALNGRIRNLISAPLLSEDSILGVINVVNRLASGDSEENKAQSGFSEEDRILLASVAHQVAIALQSVRFYEMSITDGLTGLYVHRYFQARLENEIQRARRQGHRLSLLMFDIDYFKAFNDRYGHQLGDIVLERVAGVIRAVIRENIDIPCRYGGEEFAIILPETPLLGACQLAERLRKAVEELVIEYGKEKLHITASLGVAEYPSNAETRELLIMKADEALYFSKKNGRNRVTRAGIAPEDKL